jgi:hypothetical protein
MKRIVFLLFIAMSTTTYAQSLMVIEQDTVVEINSTSVADYGFNIKIKNTSSEDLEVYVRRAYANPTCAYDSGYFCWDYCYGADIDNSIGHVAVDAGMEKNDFSGHVYSPSTSAACTDSTRYVFYSGKNANDSLSVWVTISAGPTMGTIAMQVNESSLYPNPAKNTISVEVQRYSELAIYNALGALVKREALRPGINTVALHDLSNGVYLYSLDGGTYKKLIVSH